MPSIKEYNIKLKSLKNTQKITKTMKMVSASKLRRAQEAQQSAKNYAHEITSMISRIAGTIDPTVSPLVIDPNRQIKNALIVIYTSDKGLCGAFNHNANRQVAAWIEENHKNYNKIELAFCGRRGYMFFKRHENILAHYDGITVKPDYKEALQINDTVIEGYLAGKYDEVYLSYNQFFSPISQKTIFEKVLPLDPATLTEHDLEDEAAQNTDYIFEPPTQELLDYLIPHFLAFKIYFALLENSAGEHGARMSAMDNASKNASELIEKYTLLRNRARQAQITTELTEIVAGAEALV